MYSEFEQVELDESHVLYISQLPDKYAVSAAEFNEAWILHPPTYHEIRVHHRLVKTARWQQAYGKDYEFSGTVSEALPIPNLMAPLLTGSEWQLTRSLTAFCSIGMTAALVTTLAVIETASAT